MINTSKPSLEQLRVAINKAYRQDETTCVNQLIRASQMTAELSHHISETAMALVSAVRQGKKSELDLADFLQVYQLNSQEGIALMCLAEALLRVPDKCNIDALIQDKISQFSQSENNRSSTFFINATTWALLLTGKVTSWHEQQGSKLGGALRRLVQRSGMPVIRSAVKQAMKILGKQFILGRTIDEALDNAKTQRARGYCYSYDMLGETACTEHDAKRYFDAYMQAIHSIGQSGQACPVTGDGISVKLSALHPRYEFTQLDRVLPIVIERVKALALAAKQYNIGFTIDAEEADRLDFSLDIIQHVFTDPALGDWQGFGLALQAYQKRAWYVIDWLAALAQQQQRRLMVRLIKGAYWDSEIKHSQVNGYEGYPVFTRKAATDISYLACAKKIIEYEECFYPQFATHNAHSVAAVLQLLGSRRDAEFQCLHGMGQTLYDHLLQTSQHDLPCRIYAPVGSHQELLPYLVRRLLENGANTSFVHRITDETVPVATLTADPIQQINQSTTIPHPAIPLPCDLYPGERINSPGFDLSDRHIFSTLQQGVTTHATQTVAVTPLIEGDDQFSEEPVSIVSPQCVSHVVGSCVNANEQLVEQALTAAASVRTHWEQTDVHTRAQCLLAMADLLIAQRDQLLGLLINEAGKTWMDAINEWREAIDFCRYYAEQAVTLCAQSTVLPGPTGESNQLRLHGRGIIVCISPWNFPLAIFLGQIAAALVTGNVVLAKPAEQTPLVAYVATLLFHQAGIPKAVLQLLPGTGETVGARLVSDLRIHGVMFTGSTDTARTINQTLAERHGPIIPLIAETGGQNVMLVDSTALPEQAIQDVVQSAFASAGQRCSALRVLYLQQDIAEHFITLLKGAMAELQIGDPIQLTTDVGPVIDQDALARLQTHQRELAQQATLHYQTPLPTAVQQQGHFFAPCVFEIDHISQLPTEVFGPCLHIIRYDIADLDQVLEDIQSTGYGLTMGIHSRIEHRVQAICHKMRIGNLYVNRNMIGAVVGVQPFGGEGLSGTGPKAGGPHYLARLCCERTVSIDTTAAGGNTSLMMLDDE